MTYPEDVLVAAREAAAVLAERQGYSDLAADIRNCLWDDEDDVQSACIAIMAERLWCAGIASAVAKKHEANGKMGRALGALDASDAILSQQEPGDA